MTSLWGLVKVLSQGQQGFLAAHEGGRHPGSEGIELCVCVLRGILIPNPPPPQSDYSQTDVARQELISYIS